MKVKPLGDRIVVQALAAHGTTKGGIILPDSAKEKPQEGTVLAVGRGRTLDDGTVRALSIKQGDTVLYGKYVGTEVSMDHEDLLILREDDVLAIIASNTSTSTKATATKKKK